MCSWRKVRKEKIVKEGVEGPYKDFELGSGWNDKKEWPDITYTLNECFFVYGECTIMRKRLKELRLLLSREDKQGFQRRETAGCLVRYSKSLFLFRRQSQRGMRKRGVNNNIKVCDLSDWKEEVAIYRAITGYRWNTFWDEDHKFSFRHVENKMSNRDIK